MFIFNRIQIGLIITITYTKQEDKEKSIPLWYESGLRLEYNKYYYNLVHEVPQEWIVWYGIAWWSQIFIARKADRIGSIE